MLPSLRRAVPASYQAGWASYLAAAKAPMILCAQQRRLSSSKPSSSGSNDVAAGQSVPASTSTREAGGKTTEKRKRKTKDAADRTKLPSVPSTHHMSQESLGLSSFFSLHRPISVTQTMPRTVSDEHFASIFGPRSKGNKASETMSTLSRTINQLEGPVAQMTVSNQNDEGDINNGVQRVDFRHPDGTESSIYMQVDTMSGDFLPFRPPPLPQPQIIADAADTPDPEPAQSAAESMPDYRVYSAVFTIEETMEPDGQIRIVAHSPRIVKGEHPIHAPENITGQSMSTDEPQANDDELHAISVRRQRKLRMKKKKYKKLMKRTRGIRRKLDRT